MDKALLMDTLGWGSILWLAGYVLGIVFFMVMPVAMIGWVLTPIGVALTLWVLSKKIKHFEFARYVYIGVAWCAIAIVFDYLFLVLLFQPADGYYKFDVYLYYTLTLLLPILFGWWRMQKSQN